jgi:hypothetical protein
VSCTNGAQGTVRIRGGVTVDRRASAADPARRYFGPGMISWNQTAEARSPRHVIVQSGDDQRLCGAFVVCERCLPACSRCSNPRPSASLRRALLAAVAEVDEDGAVSWMIEPCDDDHLNDYAATVITGRDGTVFVGPGAVPLPSADPMFVITAWNPRSEATRPEANDAANRDLERLLAERASLIVQVIGASLDSSWFEESFLVGGLDRRDAVELGRRFEQYAIFELNDVEVLVVESASGEPRRIVARNRPA